MHKPPRPPITHRSGNGFGHVGSTSYFGPGRPGAGIGEECDASAIRAAITEHAMFRTTFGEFQVMTFSIEEVGMRIFRHSNRRRNAKPTEGGGMRQFATFAIRRGV